MAFIGTPLDTRNTFQSLQGKRFNGDGSTTAFTLDVTPGNVLDIEVFVGNVRQDPNSAYTLSGTTLTFTGAPPSGTNNIYVVHQAKAVGTIDVPTGGVVAGSLGSSVLTGQTDIGGAIADADLFLIDDGAGGTLRKTAASRLKTYIDTAGLVKINRFTASGASSIDCTSVFSSTYEHYRATVRLLIATDNKGVHMQYFDSGGSAITESEYDYMGNFNTSAGSGTEGATASDDKIELRLNVGSMAFSNVTAEHASFDMWFDSPNLSSAYTHMGFHMVGTASDSDGAHAIGGGVHVSAEAVSGFKIFAQSGNITGEVAVFGYNIA